MVTTEKTPEIASRRRGAKRRSKSEERTKSEGSEIALPRRANDCVPDPSDFKMPAKLFDEYWREGEMALMFGPTGTGKSVLAVQMAEALARGRPIGGVEMPAKPYRVLYVDLVHTDGQFHMRRSNGRFYKFSGRFQRGSPPEGPKKLAEWLRAVVARRKYQVVIIDDLTAVRESCDGTRETLRLMRELDRLKSELGISILVLTQSRPPRRGETVTEACLLRSRVLCDTADSVFALGRYPRDPEFIYAVQLRSRSGPIYRDEDHALFASIGRRHAGLLAMEFTDAFEPEIDDETLHQIVLAHRLRENRPRPYSVRHIAAVMGISKSKVDRLIKKWRPWMDKKAADREAQRKMNVGTERLANIDQPEEPLPAEHEYENDLPDLEAEIIRRQREEDARLNAIEALRYGFDLDEVTGNTDDPVPAGEAEADSEEECREPGWPEYREETDIELPDLTTRSKREYRDSAAAHAPPLSEAAAHYLANLTTDEIFQLSGCTPGIDGNGDFIWIEKSRSNGRPIITYQPKNGRFTRWKYDIYGRYGTLVDGPVHIRNGL